MKSWARLYVEFAPGSVLDVQSIYNHLCKFYDVGYIGLYDCVTHATAYIQTRAKNVRMTRGKLQKICEQFDVITTPNTFTHRHGKLITEIGVFRYRGPKKGFKVPQDKQEVAFVHAEQPTTPLIVNLALCESSSAGVDQLVQQSDPVFVPVYTGFDRNWKIVSWNRLTKDFKRGSNTRFRDEVLDRQDHKCNYCGCDVSFGDYSNADMDHVIPLHAGGVNALHNVQVLCVPDHRKKTALESRRLSRSLSVLLDGATDVCEKK